MSERSIIFSAPMVRAILEGRKTQTRRVVRAPDIENADVWSPTPDELGRWEWGMSADGGAVGHGGFVRCPYGAPGDTLWVRETWGVGTRPCEREGWRDGIEYRADDHDLDKRDLLPLHSKCVPSDVALDEIRRGWRSPIHMPRWASRLTLRLTDVRVERLQEISEEDAIAEGMTCWVCSGPINGTSENDCACFHTKANAIPSFQVGWDSINGKRAPWSSNPWVWVVSFERVKEGVRG